MSLSRKQPTLMSSFRGCNELSKFIMIIRKHQTQLQTNPPSNRFNLNYFDYQDFENFNNVNISFINSLRNPIKKIVNKVAMPQIPQCFGVTTAASMSVHTSKDLNHISDIGKYEHLIRNRIGVRPLKGAIIFEATLRSYKRRKERWDSDFESTKIHKPGAAKLERKRQTSLQTPRGEQMSLNFDRGPYGEIAEKNMQIYQHYLTQQNGSVPYGDVNWMVSLKRDSKVQKIPLNGKKKRL